MKQKDELSYNYYKAGFTADQVNEITEGQKAGLDVSIYAKKEFLAIQMHQIRFGLLEQLPVEKYARVEFDWFQMEEIREGLKAGVNIDIYASPDISYDKMRQIRMGLLEGLDLSKFIDRDAGVIREIRKAMHSNVQLMPYVKEGYTKDQLEQIRIALEEEVPIQAFVSKELRGVSIREIRLGLSKGLDVTIYAKPECGWRQMREIRLGLEHRVDTKIYESTLYSSRQMREIRLGLEAGLDVESYCSLMYPSAEMEKRRLKLLQEAEQSRERSRKSIGQDSSVECFEQFNIYLNQDEMQAYIELNRGASPSREEIVTALKGLGITRGIPENELANVVQGDGFGRPVLIAQGQAPQAGKDGWYEFYFNPDKKKTPKLLPDGSVDYRNTEWFEVVEEGTKVAYYHDAEPGRPGYTVTGKIRPARRGRQQNILSGEGFVLEKDRKTYVSAVSGKIELRGNLLRITNLVVLQEITFATGDLQFDGSVHVLGNVGSGVCLKAAEDIIVDGYVESAELEAGGNIILRRGMNASGNGSIIAQGMVQANFLESVDVYAVGEISANYCLNATLRTEDYITVSGLRGSIVGGIAQAARGLEAYHLGNKSGRITRIKLGVSQSQEKEQVEVKEKLIEVKKELQMLQNAYAEYQRKFIPEVRNAMPVFLKLEDAIYTKNEQLKELRAEKSIRDGKLYQMRQAKAVVRGKIHEGTIIEICGCKWDAKEVQSVTVKYTGEKVALFRNEISRKG